MDNDRSEFKFSADDQRPDSLLRSSRKNKRIEKNPPGGLSAFLFIILFLILAAGAGGGYYHLTRQIEALQGKDAQQTQALVEDLENRFSSMTDQYKEIEESMKKKMFPMDEIFLALEKATGNLDKALKQAEKEIAGMKTAKADKKDVDNALEKILAKTLAKTAGEIEKGFAPVKQTLADFKEEFKLLKESYEKENTAHTEKLAEVTGQITQIDKTVNEFKEDIAELSSEKIDQVILDIALERQQKKLAENLAVSLRKHRKTLQGELNLVLKNLDQKEKQIASLQKKMKQVQKNTAARVSRPTNKKPLSPLKPGMIIEQDIQ